MRLHAAGERRDVPPLGEVRSSVLPPKVSGDARSESSLGSGDDGTVGQEISAVMDRPNLTPLEGGGDGYDGMTLMNEVFDLMRRRLPRLRLDDPQRPVVSEFLVALGPRLGRDPLVAVREGRESLPG